MVDDRVPAAPARMHVLGLVESGMTQAAICRAADTSSANVSALIHSQYNASRSPVVTIDAATASRLLAVQLELPQVRSTVCDPGDRFERVGYRVGRCDDCGQLAPLHQLNSTQGSHVVLIRHQRLNSTPEPVKVADAAALLMTHPDCGSTKGAQRHRRERTDLCGPCRNVARGYDAGYKAAMTRAARDRAALPLPLAEAVVRAMRAFVLRRPAPRLRELAIEVVRIADAELTADEHELAA